MLAGFSIGRCSPQSSHCNFLTIVNLVYIRMTKQKRARAKKAEPMPKVIGTRVGGCRKLGSMPGGGSPAGIVCSAAGGRLLMILGSKSPVDIVTDSAMKELQEQVRCARHATDFL